MNDEIKKLDEFPLYIKAAVTIFVLAMVLFVGLIFSQNQPLLIGDDMSVQFEHQYSDLREKELPIYQNIQLDGTAMVITFRNLSLTRKYLFFQEETRNEIGMWHEFNNTDSVTFWFAHGNRGFDLLVWMERDMGKSQGWFWIIAFKVIDD